MRNRFHNIIIGFLSLSLFCFFFACRRSRINWHFYHWKLDKGTQSASTYLTDKFNTWPISTLYFHIVDVAWDSRQKAPVPQAVADIGSHTPIPENKLLIPVIFIKNEVMLHCDSMRIKQLAQKLIQTKQQFFKHIAISESRELQIDCDWTPKTRDKYFYLLQELQTADPDLELSVTIRLYPYKYRKTMGIPPADYGVLMCYNMSPFQSKNTRNSILDPEVLKKYLQTKPYQLKLKAAIPIFGWHVWLRNEQIKGIRYFPPDFSKLPCFTPVKDNRYAFTKDTTIGSDYFRKGDILRNEFPEEKLILESVKILIRELPGVQDIIFYHGEETLIRHYESTIETLLDKY